MTSKRWRLAACGLGALVLSDACTRRVLDVNTTVAIPALHAPERSAVSDALKACEGFGRFTAHMILRGEVGGQRVSSRMWLGTMLGNFVRIESQGPDARLPFVAAVANEGVIYLPDSGEVARDASGEAVIQAIFGVPLSGRDLFRLLTGGCHYDGGGVVAYGRAGGLLRVTVGEDEFVLRGPRTGPWMVRSYSPAPSATGQRWRAVYDRRAGEQLPFRIRLSSLEWNGLDGRRFDLTFTLDRVQVEPPLTRTVFSIDVPASATPISLQAVTNAGPLIGRSRGTSP